MHVSVVTPFYNSADTLSRCIESVLEQSHGDFEYVLADNCSTDGSGAIAGSYAARDSRIRYVAPDAHVAQGANYNRALRLMSPRATYCKIVQADDVLLPRCLERMLALAERHPRVGVVSSHRLIDEVVEDAGAGRLPEAIPGPEVCRRTLRGEVYAFGSPTTVMYRADLVRARPEFYRKDAFFDDLDATIDVLLESDFGFVPEVLTQTTRDPDSTLGRVLSYDIDVLYRHLTLHRMGDALFEPDELSALKHETSATYYQRLVRAFLKRPDRLRYFRFHAEVLRKSAGMSISLGRLARAMSSLGRRQVRKRFGLLPT